MDTLDDLRLKRIKPFVQAILHYRGSVEFRLDTDISQCTIYLTSHMGRLFNDRLSWQLWLVVRSIGVTLMDGTSLVFVTPQDCMRSSQAFRNQRGSLLIGRNGGFRQRRFKLQGLLSHFNSDSVECVFEIAEFCGQIRPRACEVWAFSLVYSIGLFDAKTQ